ncbi:MAG: threonine dehydratase [Ideonella sp.]|nr:threonine dehydratase [Ideonella sp.]
MQLPTRDEILSARAIVAAVQQPTPTQRWPLLDARLGARAWVKHENHTRVGAFKLRGGAVYLHELMRRAPQLRGVISATRGNHGQSIALAAARHGIAATIVVPHGNSVEKNAAMRALGATLVEHGEDFQQAREHAARLAAESGWPMVPSFHPDLVRGVASYWMEFFEATACDAPAVVFVPIGLGSGIVACAAARAACLANTKGGTRIVGVVSAHATAYLDSWRAGRPVEAPVTTQLADGMACRVPEAEALEIMRREVDDIVAVTDEEVAHAMRALFADTHNVAEGAGAAALAAALQQCERLAGCSIGLALTGGNVDSAVFAHVLAGAAAS